MKFLVTQGWIDNVNSQLPIDMKIESEVDDLFNMYIESAVLDFVKSNTNTSIDWDAEIANLTELVDVFSSSFIATTHYTNLYTWLLHAETNQDAVDSLEIIRNLNVSLLHEFALKVLLFGLATTFPLYIEKALVYYMRYFESIMPADKYAQLKGYVLQGVGDDVSNLPESISTLLQQ